MTTTSCTRSGIEQARLLGAHLAQRGQRFDAVYVGPLRRQRETLRLMREAGGAARPGPRSTCSKAWPKVRSSCCTRSTCSSAWRAMRCVRGHVARLRAVPAEREAIIDQIFVHMVELWTSGSDRR